MGDFSIVVTGLSELEKTLNVDWVKTGRDLRAVVNRGALNVKMDWRSRWRGMKHLPALPYAVTYDMRVLGGTVSAEIGPDKAKNQGPLGNIIEFGSPTSAPIPGGLPALMREEPRFVSSLEKLMRDVLNG